MYKLKLLFVGPAASGKTTIANFLADMPENLGGSAYRPTEGVRILEFETQVGEENDVPTKTQIELWDCGICQKLEFCWPAFQSEAHGVVFVFDPSNPSHVPELEKLYNCFVTQTGMNPSNCMLIAHHKRSGDRETKYLTRLANTFARVFQIQANVDENGIRLLSDFNTYFSAILAGLKDRNEQEELNIMNMQTF